MASAAAAITGPPRTRQSSNTRASSRPARDWALRRAPSIRPKPGPSMKSPQKATRLAVQTMAAGARPGATGKAAPHRISWRWATPARAPPPVGRSPSQGARAPATAPSRAAMSAASCLAPPLAAGPQLAAGPETPPWATTAQRPSARGWIDSRRSPQCRWAAASRLSSRKGSSSHRAAAPVSIVSIRLVRDSISILPIAARAVSRAPSPRALDARCSGTSDQPNRSMARGWASRVPESTSQSTSPSTAPVASASRQPPWVRTSRPRTRVP